jgi:alpha-galactosidase
MGPNLGIGSAAPGLGRSPEDHQIGRLILQIGLSEYLRPHHLGVLEHVTDEGNLVSPRVLRRIQRRFLCRLGSRGEDVDQIAHARVSTEEHEGEDDEESDTAAPGSYLGETSAAPTSVDDAART